MTNVVIDTNVVISGIFWGGPPGHLLKIVNQGAIKQYATPEIVEEYEEISQRLGLRLKVDYRSALDLILRNLILVAPAKLKNQVCEDADDDIFIHCALAARAISSSRETSYYSK